MRSVWRLRGTLRWAWAPILLCTVGCRPPDADAPTRLIVWAWERPEDLRFLPKGVDIAVQTGFIEVAGDAMFARGRRFALLANGPPAVAVVHLQIDERRPPAWTPALRQRVAAAVVHFARVVPTRTVQIDFEVRASQRQILRDVIADARRELGPGVRLSMTALASWCQEGWLGDLPVDEVVPMLFRMGRGDPSVRRRIAAGGDFRDPACRHALAIATDTPIARAPIGRSVYLFDPRRWTRADFAAVQAEVEGWR